MKRLNKPTNNIKKVTDRHLFYKYIACCEKSTTTIQLPQTGEKFLMKKCVHLAFIIHKSDSYSLKD